VKEMREEQSCRPGSDDSDLCAQGFVSPESRTICRKKPLVILWKLGRGLVNPTTWNPTCITASKEMDSSPRQGRDANTALRSE
jgi:hypothetical protein